MTLPKELTTVTTFSKSLALFLFIVLPILSFFLGMRYSQIIYTSMQPDIVYTRPPSINSDIPTPVPTSSINGWHVYENKEFNFSLEYPNNFDISKEYKAPAGYSPLLNVGFFPKETTSGSRQSISIYVWSNTESLSAQKWVDTYTTGKEYQKIQLTVSGENAIRINDLHERIKSDSVFISKDKKIFRITLLKEAGTRIPAETFDQILSTFKFTN